MSGITFFSCRPAARLHPAGLVRRPGRGDGDLFWGRLSCLLPGDFSRISRLAWSWLSCNNYLDILMGEACCQVLNDARSGELHRDICPTKRRFYSNFRPFYVNFRHFHIIYSDYHRCPTVNLNHILLTSIKIWLKIISQGKNTCGPLCASCSRVRPKSI